MNTAIFHITSAHFTGSMNSELNYQKHFGVHVSSSYKI